MPEEPLAPQQIPYGDALNTLSRFVTQLVLMLGPLAVFALYRIFADSAKLRYFVLVAASTLCVVAVGAHLLHAIVASSRPRRRSWTGVLLAAVAPAVPFLFSIYLILLEGLWRLRLLRYGFSLRLVLGALAFVVLGWLLIKITDRATAFSAALYEHRLVVPAKKAAPAR